MAEADVRKILGDLTNIESNIEEQMLKGEMSLYPPKIDQVKVEAIEDSYNPQSILPPMPNQGCIQETTELIEDLHHEVVFKISYQNLNKLLPGFPINIKTLQLTIRSMFKLDFMFNLFFMDPSGDRIDIATNKDIKAIAQTLGGQNSRIVKIYVWPKHFLLPSSKSGISEVDKIWEGMENSKKLVHFNNRSRKIAKSIGTDEKIVRKETTYLLEFSFGERLFYK